MYDHVEVYLDESGDLGFSPRSSRHIVVAVIAFHGSYVPGRLVRAARKRLSPNDRRMVELKFNKSPDRLRRLLLADVAKTDCQIAWCAVEKYRLPSRSVVESGQLLHSMSALAVSEISRMTRAKSIAVVVDKRWTKERLRAELDSCLEDAVESCHSGHFAPSVRVSHLDSMTSAGLQLADFVAGAVFRSIERADESYLGIIRERIICGKLD